MVEHLIHPVEKTEHLPPSPEKQQNAERPAHHKKEADHHAEKQPEVHELAKSAQEHAISSEKTSVGEKHHDNTRPILGMHQELKSKAYKQTLKKVRTQLQASDKVFSRFVHQPVVEVASEISAKTVARPSGILGGGISALLGSSIILYMSKYYGFRYNFFFFILLFAAGFAVGMIIELLLRAIKRKNV